MAMLKTHTSQAYQATEQYTASHYQGHLIRGSPIVTSG